MSRALRVTSPRIGSRIGFRAEGQSVNGAQCEPGAEERVKCCVVRRLFVIKEEKEEECKLVVCQMLCLSRWLLERASGQLLSL